MALSARSQKTNRSGKVERYTPCPELLTQIDFAVRYTTLSGSVRIGQLHRLHSIFSTETQRKTRKECLNGHR